MLPELDNVDWHEVFKYAGESPGEGSIDPGMMPERARPNTWTDCSSCNRGDVVRIIAMEDGENDGPEWVGVFEMKGGRFLAVSAGCDYTGWG